MASGRTPSPQSRRRPKPRRPSAPPARRPSPPPEMAWLKIPRYTERINRTGTPANGQLAPPTAGPRHDPAIPRRQHRRRPIRPPRLRGLFRRRLRSGAGHASVRERPAFVIEPLRAFRGWHRTHGIFIHKCYAFRGRGGILGAIATAATREPPPCLMPTSCRAYAASTHNRPGTPAGPPPWPWSNPGTLALVFMSCGKPWCRWDRPGSATTTPIRPSRRHKATRSSRRPG